ncbi:MAG: cytochrome P460 family protein, partial [Saprospiraceae bacterium]|nr:cytochrome P460 family protein [Saprospiraceae bacterium]
MYKFKIWVVAGLCFISVVWLSSAVRPNLPNETNEPDRLPLPTDAFSRGISLHDYEVKYLFPYLEKRIYDQEGYAKKRGWVMDKMVRNTGPFINGKSYGVHPAVRIFYSPEVYRWLKNGRVGVIPDGAMIIKEMLPTPSARYEHLKKEEVDATVKEWTVMIKDSKGARDGWFWSYYGVDLPADTDSYPFDYPNSGFGNYCIRCHASAVSEFTFSSLDNILGEEGDPIQYFVDDSWQNDVTPDSTESHANLAEVLTPGSAVVGEDPVANSLFLKQFDSWEQIAYDSVRKIPSETYDHVVAPGMGTSKKSQSNQQFLTSDQCMSCHDGNGAPFGPNMLDPSSGENLSPYGEWNWSMMGLAGRDPIFFAQIESEMALQPQQSKMLMNTCFRC